MSAQLALYLCWGGIVWLMRQDMKWRPLGTRILLVPGIWLAIQGSRPVSYWFGHGGGSESNPINTVTFALLIGSGILILANRNFNWGKFIRHNRILCLLYAYMALTALWSDSPLTSLKRLFKDFGCVLLPLVLLIQADPIKAIRAVFVRVSYVLFPLSVVFIKYFPHIGRTFTRAGEPMYGGVTTQKNSLGEVGFVFGLMLLWDLMEIYKDKERRKRKLHLAVRLTMLLMGLWLLWTCDSQTSLLCLVLGVVIYWCSQRLLRMRHGKKLLITGLVTIACLVTLDKSLGISAAVIRAMGRDPTLTGRTDIWRIVLEQKTDPLLGMGFYTFWDSDKGRAVTDEFMQINSAHNGYLETYVDGGLIGVALLCLMLLAAGWRIINRLFSGHPLGPVGLVFWLLSILYNFSETSFLRLDPLWFTLLLVSIEYPRRLKVAPVIAPSSAGEQASTPQSGGASTQQVESNACSHR